MDLPTYYRSASSNRPWDALVFKALEDRAVSVNTIHGSGEHRRPHYLALSPQGRVPTLRPDDGDPVMYAPTILEAGAAC